MDFNGKRALVTGGSRGIGKAIAKALIDHGARVVITGRNAEVLEASAKELGAIPVRADAALEADCVRSVEEAVKALGGLDVLVNNAGIGRGARSPRPPWT